MLGALILAGGTSTRMGADKAALTCLGSRYVDHVAALARSAGAETFLTVGPVDYGLPFVSEEPHFGGPVGGVVAGMAALRAIDCKRVLVLAVDAPTIQLHDLRPLLDDEGRGATFDGLHLPMILNIDAITDGVRADWPLARLVDAAALKRLTCNPEAWVRLRGANTPDEQAGLSLLGEALSTPRDASPR